MNTVVSILLSIVNNSYSKDANYSIALTLLRNCTKPELLTLSRVANESYCSTTLVNKFCKMLGYKNFTDLKNDLIIKINVRREQIHYRMLKMDEESILNNIKIYSPKDFDIEQFKKEVDVFLEKVYEKEEIVLTGGTFPTALAANFQEDLCVSGKLVYTAPQKTDIDIDYSKKDALIVLVTLTGKIYDYAKDNFDKACKNKNNEFMIISGYKGFPKRSAIKGYVNVPMVDDNEVANILFLEIFRYMKYKYYKKYVRFY